MTRILVWDIRLRKDVHDWEEEALLALLARVYDLQRVGEVGDEVCWNLSQTRSFQVKSYYQVLCVCRWWFFWMVCGPRKDSYY